MSKETNIKKEVMEWVKSIALAVVIAFVIKMFLFDTTYVVGSSMFPTLHNKDRLFTNKIGYLLKTPQRGDIVVIEAPDDPDKDYIKRIAGVEGDLVEIKNGHVYVNGELYEEDYIKQDIDTQGDISIQVPQGEIFVLGDNRELGASKDSRYFGTVKEEAVKGRAVFRYFPFGERFGVLH
ncbi:signal peptidase I [Abyssisolibacter fermentans]|uniref:signal peptidase I n=1 Tax=Abyssisolibacter fermentans TaxID=1766203 RepID=UPI00082E4AB6|nr:signal peptidase I [Abyssisolibacter fermentans]